MISSATRSLLYVLAGLYGLLAFILFAAPTWSSANFAWKVSPLVAMTMGGWCFGNAWGAFISAWRGFWPLAFGASVYLSCFGASETAVVIAFRSRLLVESPLAWLYLATLAINCVFAVVAWLEWTRRRPLLKAIGHPNGVLLNTLAVVFVLFVGFLGVYGLIAVEGMRGLNRAIFPEVLSPFTLRAFGAFYLCIALGVVPLLFARGRDNVLAHGLASYGALVAITVAAIAFIDVFDFAARPTQLIYPGIYVLVGTVVGIYLARYGVGRVPV
jgi:hypothetical protein